MKKILIPLFLFFATFFTAACSPSSKQVEQALQKDPDILVRLIEKHPKKFIEAFQKAAQSAESDQQQVAEQEEKARLEREYKNPLQPDLSQKRPFKGGDSAAVTIVGYSDFQCPYCKRGFEVIEEVMKTYGDKVKYIHKHLPLPMHPMADPSARRYEALALQSPALALKFHDEVFKNQGKLNQEGEKFLDAAAKKVGGNVAKMKKDMNSEQIQAQIRADMAEAEKFGIQGTPGFIISGVSLRGAYPFPSFKEIIDRKLSGSK